MSFISRLRELECIGYIYILRFPLKSSKLASLLELPHEVHLQQNTFSLQKSLSKEDTFSTHI